MDDNTNKKKDDNNNNAFDFVNIEIREEISKKKKNEKNKDLNINNISYKSEKANINNNKNLYPDLDKKSEKSKKNEEPLHLSFEMLDDEEVQNLRLLSGNRNDQSFNDPNDDIVNNNLVFSSKGKNTSSGQPKNNIKEIMNLYTLLLEDNKTLLKNKEYFIITEKEDIKDLIGKHKLYELSFVNSANFKSIKCYRRFRHFSLLHERLKTKYPYIIIPKLPPQKDFSKIIASDKIFEEERLYQLNFYLNFIFSHENLRNTKEFFKFTEEPTLDLTYFSDKLNNSTSNTYDDLDLIYMNVNYLNEITSKKSNYSLSSSISSIYNYFTSSGTKKREINDSEIIIKKMATHFNNIIKQYTEIAKSIENIFKSNEDEANANKKISEVFLYLKDSFIHLDNYDKVMLKYSERTKILSNRQIESLKKASKLKHKLSALINLLHGICYTLEKYLNFISKYNKLNGKIAEAKKKGNKNLNDLMKTYQIYETVKNKFEMQLSKETNIYCQIYDETTYECLLQFREVLESSTILKINNKESDKKEDIKK